MSSKLEQLLQLANLIKEPEEITISGTSLSNSPFSPGKKVFIRTVTHFQVGEIVSVDQTFVQLKNASWIADSKRWYDCLKNGFNDSAEIEPEPNNVWIAIGSIVDVREWFHELPTKQQ